MIKKIYKQMNNHGYLTVFILGMIAGLIGFLFIYGPNVLDVTYVDWLKGGEDLAQHYLGWAAYRDSSWTFPIGLVENIIYPQKVSIIYTDSIPILAVIFKTLSPLLPDTFQYFGIWGAFCYMFSTSIVSVMIKKYTKNLFLPVVSALFFSFSSVMLQRMFGHTALAANWLILCAFFICVFSEKFNTISRNLLAWGILAVLAVGVHMYYIPMVFGIMFFYLFDKFLEDKKIKNALIPFIGSILLALSFMFILGAFYGQSGLENEGLGVYSANLNTLYNPYGIGSILSSIITLELQGEGMGYLGVGMILLMVIAISIYIEEFDTKISLKKRIRSNRRPVIAGIACLVFLFLALSPVITWNDKVLLTIPYPDFITDILSIFRASGRFIWPVMYFIMFITLRKLIKKHSTRTAFIIVGICCMIQFLDFENVINDKGNQEYFKNKIAYDSTLRSQAWNEIAENKEGIVYLYTDANSYNEVVYAHLPMETVLDISQFASDHNLHTSDFYIGSRVDLTKKAIEKAERWQSIQQEAGNENLIYIFDKNPSNLLKDSPLYLYKIDYIYVGISWPLTGDYRSENFQDLNDGDTIDIALDHYLGMENGIDTEQGRILSYNGQSYGPYIPLVKGTYQVQIQGENLDFSNINVYCQQGQHFEELTLISEGEERVVLEFTLDMDVQDLEIAIRNNAYKYVTIKQMVIQSN